MLLELATGRWSAELLGAFEISRARAAVRSGGGERQGR